MPTTYSAPGSVIVDVAGYGDDAHDVVLQPDGTILVAGFSDHSDQLDDGYDFSLAHLTADGSLDSSYGHAGRLVIHKQIAVEKTYNLQVQADGAVVTAHAGHDATPIIQRWGADGKADSAFDSNALASLPSGFGDAPLVQGNTDGTLLVAAVVGSQLHVAQLLADGTLDSSFGNAGTLTLQAGAPLQFVESITALADGGLLLHAAPSVQNSLFKYTADGLLDTSFGDNGRVALDGVASYRGDVAVQEDGKLLLATTTDFHDFAVLRLNADGSRDTGFGTDGLVSVDLPGDSAQATTIAVQDDGKLLVAGYAYANGGEDLATVRLNSDGSLDTGYGSADGNTRLVGSAGSDVLQGLDSDEILRGLSGDDRLQGNLGRDLLSGGSGADTFVYAGVADSFRTATASHSDRILDFDPSGDHIDLSALGFTGIGNGYDGTLAIGSNADATRTYLKSYQANTDGQRFELVLDGNLAAQLDDSNLIFNADGTQPELVALGVQHDQLLG